MRAILATGADPDADADNTFSVRPIHSAVAVGDHDVARARCSRRGPNPTSSSRAATRRWTRRCTTQDSEMEELLRRHGAVSR